jgi:hypothetical protein
MIDATVLTDNDSASDHNVLGMNKTQAGTDTTAMAPGPKKHIGDEKAKYCFEKQI